MKLSEYFRLRADIIKRAKGRTDRLDSGEADASWQTALQDEWNMEILEQLGRLQALLAPDPDSLEPISVQRIRLEDEARAAAKAAQAAKAKKG